MGPPSPQRHGEEEGFWECSSPSQGQRLMEFLGAVSCIPQLAPACSSLLQLALACSSLLQLAPACINLAALGFFSGVVTKEPSLQERHPQVFPPGTHLMSLLVGHLRPEPYPRLLHPPTPVSLNSNRAQPVKKARDNSPSCPYCLYSGSGEHEEHVAWGIGVEDLSTTV